MPARTPLVVALLSFLPMLFVAAPASGQDSQRLLLSGSHLQIRDDTAWLAEQGVTEVFYDLNWDPQIGSPHADQDAATDRAAELLEALAPAPA